MQRFTLTIITSYMLFSLLHTAISVALLYVIKRYILRKDVNQNLPTLKQCLNWCRMSNERIYYRIMWLVLHLKNNSILYEVDRVTFRHRYNKILSDWSPLRPPNCTLTVERKYSIITARNTFRITSIIKIELWRDTFHFESNCSIFPHSVVS